MCLTRNDGARSKTCHESWITWMGFLPPKNWEQSRKQSPDHGAHPVLPEKSNYLVMNMSLTALKFCTNCPCIARAHNKHAPFGQAKGLSFAYTLIQICVLKCRSMLALAWWRNDNETCMRFAPLIIERGPASSFRLYTKFASFLSMQIGVYDT